VLSGSSITRERITPEPAKLLASVALALGVTALVSAQRAGPCLPFGHRRRRRHGARKDVGGARVSPDGFRADSQLTTADSAVSGAGNMQSLPGG
jgi:hypothetical protein